MRVIVVDDCSEDKTPDILCELTKTQSNLEIIFLDSNKGPGIARNIGASGVSADWLWFLDDDDTLDPLALAKLMPSLNIDCDVLAHSLSENLQPTDDGFNANTLANEVIMFREKQEVFNYVFRNKFYQNNSINFSSGLHEDIRVVFECLTKCDKLFILNEIIVKKTTTKNSITSKFNRARIDGYIKAYYEIVSIIGKNKNYKSKYKLSEIYTQFLGVILYLAIKNNEKNPHLLLAYLADLEFSKEFTQCMGEYSDTDTNFRLACKIWSKRETVNFERLFSEIKNVFSSHLSCKDLNSSLFFGPAEIRACCKRFFVDGEQKGDVVLLNAAKDINYKQIVSAKQNLLRKINTGTSQECSGCPYIGRYKLEKTQEVIDYISFENFSYCNMRCTYCSPKYYGGSEAVYDALAITQSVAEAPNKIATDAHIVWGGGEPTLSPKFEAINTALQENSNVGKIRILSNSLKYSKKLETLLIDPRYHLVTSIDAGTQDMFMSIRQKGNIDTVLNNLAEYKSVLSDNKRLTVKYIVTDQNYTTNELEAFVKKLEQHSLLDCLLQISCDFTVEIAYENMVCAIYELGARLFAAGAKFVFFDDLIRDRVTISEALEKRVRDHFDALDLPNQFLLNKSSAAAIFIWGRGLQSAWYQNHTQFGLTKKFNGTVKDIHELTVNLKNITPNKFYIFPGGVQSYYEIIENIEKAGVQEHLCQKLVL